MFKRLVSLALALVLMLCAMPAMAAIDDHSTLFIPAIMSSIFNIKRNQVISIFSEEDIFDEDELDFIRESLALPTEPDVTDTVVSYANGYGTFSITAFFDDPATDPDYQIANRIAFDISDSLGRNTRITLLYTLAVVLRTIDTDSDYDDLFDWLADDGSLGDSYALGGYTLYPERIEGTGYCYTLEISPELMALGLANQEAQDAALPDSFVPERLAQTFNEFAGHMIDEALAGWSEADQAAMSQTLTLSFTEIDGEIVYYNNADWSLELAGYYDGRAVEPDQQADTVGLVLHDGLGQNAIDVGRMALVAALLTLDNSQDVDALFNWITGASESGTRYDMDGYSLVLRREDDFWNYTLMPASRVLSDANSGADAVPEVPTGEAVGIGDALIEWNGFSVQLLRVEPESFSSGSTYLTFYCRFINDSSRALWLRLEDATVNGLPVDGVGETGIEPGTDSDDDMFLKPNSPDDTAAEALLAPRTTTFTLRLVDDETYEELASRKVTLDLEGMFGE